MSTIKTTIEMRQERTIQKIDKKEIDQLRLFMLKHELQTAFAAETHLAEGQWQEEQADMVKLRMFRAGTRMPTLSRTEGEHLVLLKTFIKK
jgi:hypothetical protein